MDMGKPNIIFILLDDYGWADSTCYGSEFYETPNLDRENCCVITAVVGK